MARQRKPPDPERAAQLRAELRRYAQERSKGYRARALALFPHVCARCGREFSGKRLKELTVHHKDHDHTNNPADGSNWELLCIYCHDDEHEKEKRSGTYAGDTFEKDNAPPPLANPFDSLDSLLGDDRRE